MQILSTKRFVTDDPSARVFASRDVFVDEHGRTLGVRTHHSDAERLRASVEVAVRQGRIPSDRAQHFLDLGANDADQAIETLLAMPASLPNQNEVYATYAAATGVIRHARPTPVAEDAAYAEFAGRCGISSPATIRLAQQPVSQA